MDLTNVLKIAELITKGVSYCKNNKNNIVIDEDESKWVQKSNDNATLLIMQKPYIVEENEDGYKIAFVFTTSKSPVGSVNIIPRNKNIIGIILDPTKEKYVKNYIWKSEFNQDKSKFYIYVNVNETFNSNKILSFGLEVQSIWGYYTRQMCNVLITFAGSLSDDITVVV